MTFRLGQAAARLCDKFLTIGFLMFGASIPESGQTTGAWPERMGVKSPRRTSVLSGSPVPGFSTTGQSVGLDSDAMPARGTVQERGNDRDA
jgi:hypothetical protein